MKHLAPFFCLIVGFMACSSSLNKPHFDVISNLDDSIVSIIEGKEFLYYTKGHHGHIWSLVVSEKERYILISGNTRKNDCLRIDTIYTSEPILKWGLDTMKSYCHKMKPVEKSSYWPFYERLVLFSSSREPIFDCTETDTYSGTDSVIFNKKLNELKYFMYWNAVPIEIKEKLPSPR